MELTEAAILKAIQDLTKRMERLEETLKENKNVHLQIQQVETLNLENLIYHLDHVDIKDLSGILNIGNTFDQSHTSLKRNAKSPMNLSPAPSGKKDLSILINGKEVPYTIENGDEGGTEHALPSSTEFTIGDIHIGTIEDASAVNFGNNFPTNFRSNKKHNQGLGNIVGNNNDIHDLKSFMKEKNAGEVYNENQEDQPPDWLDKLEKEEEEEVTLDVNTPSPE
jgi:hypothetical protein